MTSRYNQYHNFNKIFCLVLIPGLRILGRTSHWECLACHMIHVPRSQRRHKAPGDLRLRATGRRSEERDRKCSFHLPMCVDLSCAFWWSLLFYISFCLPSFPCLGIFFFPSHSSFFFYLVQEWHILFLSFGTFLETGSLINWIYRSLTLFSLFILLKPPRWSARVHSRPLQAVLRIAVKVRVWLTLFLMCHVYLKITQNLTQRHLFDQKRKSLW